MSPTLPLPARPVEVHVAPTAAVDSASDAGPWYRAAIPAHPLLWLSAFIIACGWDRAVWVFVSQRTVPLIEVIEGTALRRAISGLFSWDPAMVLHTCQYFAYQGIKSFGTAWVSTAIAAVIVIRSLFEPDTRRVRVALRRGVLVFLCPAAAGLVAEGLKLTFRRERPEFADGHYSFRLHDWLNGSGLGLPSSHAAVAIGTAMALSILFPARRWLWVGLAAMCCLSRVLAGAHFVSDVLLGVLVGLCAARAVLALDFKNNRGVAVPA